VACIVEEVGVDVERGGRACVSEDATDLHHVEVEVDDEMAGEGVAQVVEAQARAVLIQARGLGGTG